MVSHGLGCQADFGGCDMKAEECCFPSCALLDASATDRVCKWGRDESSGYW